MNHRSKAIAGSLAAAGIVGGFAVAGQYAGSALFAKWQQLPQSVVGIFTLHDYWVAYGDVKKVRLALAACTFVSAVVPLAPIGIAVLALFSKPKRELHGSARFANANEISRSGLLDEALGRNAKKRKPSIIVGKYRGKYLTYAGQEFVLLAAPTRSGKGVAVVIPNLLTYPDSVVVLDIKGENYDITSGYRQQCGQKVFRWAPFDESGCTHRWNPLARIAASAPHLRVDLLQALSARLYHAPDPRHRFFYDTAAELFMGVALYLIETGRRCSFGEILRQGSAQKALREHLADMVATKGLSADCASALGRVLAAPDETMGSVSSTFYGGLRIFANPIVDAATTESDDPADNIDVTRVRRERMSIYLVLPARRLAIAGVLGNLFFSQLIDQNMDATRADDPSIICQCLMINDEFTSMGRVDVIAMSNAYIAGYDMRLLTIVQSVAQMEPPELYGPHGTRTLVVNHGLKVVYPPRDPREAKDVSASLGTFTMLARSKGRSTGKGTSRSENTSEHARALMNEIELQEMPQQEEIIVGKGKPIRCEKAYYYNDAFFVDRLKSVSPMLKGIGRAIPSQEQLEAARQSGELAAKGAPRTDIAQWHAQVSVATRGDAAVRPLTAREQLELDQLLVGEQVLSAVMVGVADDVEELTGRRPDVADLLDGLPALGAAVDAVDSYAEAADA